MNSYQVMCVKAYAGLMSALEGRMDDDRGEISSYLVFVALLVAAVGVLATTFDTLFGNLMTKVCTTAGTTC